MKMNKTLMDMKTKQECSVCSVKIWEYNGVKLKKTDEYNEIDVALDNLSKMTIGVCSRHLKPSKLELQMITEKTHQGWLEEVALGVGDEEWVKNTGLNLKVVGTQ